MTATTAPPRQRAGNRNGVMAAVGVLVAVVLVAGSTLLARGPAMVDVTIENESSAPVMVTVFGRDGSSVLPIGTVPAGSHTKFRAVIDQGDDWHFALTVGPDRVGELRRTRAQLDAAGWTVTIPASVATGVHPSEG